MASWFFAIEGLFQDALHEVLKLEAVLAGVDFEAAVEIGGDFESRRWDWWWWSGHGRKFARYSRVPVGCYQISSSRLSSRYSLRASSIAWSSASASSSLIIAAVLFFIIVRLVNEMIKSHLPRAVK